MRTITILTIILFIGISGIAENNHDNNIVWNNSFQKNVNKPEIKVYPNPSFGKNLTVEIKNQEIIEIQLTNIAGKKVYQEKHPFPAKKLEIQVNSFTNGIYLLRVKTTENHILVKKVSISKK